MTSGSSQRPHSLRCCALMRVISLWLLPEQVRACAEAAASACCQRPCQELWIASAQPKWFEYYHAFPQTLCPCQPAAAVPVKRYKRRMEQQIGNCVQDTTAPLLQKCSQLAAAGENTDKKTNEILEEAHNFVMQVRRSPCAPAAGKPSGCCA